MVAPRCRARRLICSSILLLCMLSVSGATTAVSSHLPRSLHADHDEPLSLRGLKIWFAGPVPRLSSSELLAFESSTVMSLSGLLSSGSLSVAHAAQHEAYLSCDVELTDAAPLNAAAFHESAFRKALRRSFADPAFVGSYLALLRTSLPGPFRDVTGASLSAPTARPSVSPTAAPPRVLVEGLLLAIRGTRGFNVFEWHLLRTTTEQYLTDALRAAGYRNVRTVRLRIRLPSDDAGTDALTMRVAATVEFGEATTLTADVEGGLPGRLAVAMTSAAAHDGGAYLDTLAVLSRRDITGASLRRRTAAPSFRPSAGPSVAT
eukprot:CAMPEP_0194300254 /NCGR_PEP_ID=MMETSP0169-20130528/61155_1 /TAXON_ID=218684 /ORGANISM="Corethron pennatum, Strain L29A3" /LENGTH=318 /DNA_ID=CAMNT_0039050407 /DNA_START=160 /DNA_END=1113 /DNA_ORIENTATION=-